MNDFQVGDRVVCISTGSSRYLVVGREYTVESFRDDGEFLTVKEIHCPHTYFPSRFIPANLNLENK